jgi:uncharacterized protein YigA (DUF484 family)
VPLICSLTVWAVLRKEISELENKLIGIFREARNKDRTKQRIK